MVSGDGTGYRNGHAEAFQLEWRVSGADEVSETQSDAEPAGVADSASGTSMKLYGTQLKESPQAHDPVAFGLSIVKPCFSIVSTKSMDAPST